MPSLARGSYAYNLSFAFGRNAVMVLTQLMFTPIIVRIYSPESYGVLGAVLSLSAMFLSLFTLQYERALYMARSEQEVYSLRVVCNIMPVHLSILLGLVILIGGRPLLSMVGLADIGVSTMLVVPLLVMVSAWAQTSQHMTAVRYRYKESFIYNGIGGIGAKLVAIIAGIITGGNFLGLLFSELFSRAAQVVTNSRLVLRERSTLGWRDLDLRAHFAVMKEYKGFPRYELPGMALNALSNQVPLLWIPTVHGMAAFGQFSLGQSLLEMPMRLFGYSITDTYYQKAVTIHREHGLRALRHSTLRMMGLLAAVAMAPILVIAIWSPALFAWLFGEEWRVAGELSSVLALFYFVRLVIEPVASVLRLMDRQRHILWFRSLLLVFRVASAFLAVQLGLDLIKAMTLFATANALAYLLLGVQIIFFLSRPHGQVDHTRTTNGPPSPGP